MNNEIQIFKSERFGEIRTEVINGEPYFVGKDIATALGYSNTNDAVSQHVDDEDKIMGSQNTTPSVKDQLGRNQYPTWINESGVYSLVFGSQLQDAKKFKHWITHDVIPAIRKTGSYSAKPLSQLEILQQSVNVLVEHESRIKELEQRLDASDRERKENTEALLALPLSQNTLPQQDLKSKVRELVNAYSGMANVKFEDVWHKVYGQLYYIHHISVNSYKKLTPKESKLSVAERNGFLDKIFDIISNLIREAKQK
jgi:prophage antirepressor-like protein